ncbi:glutaredoxin family protein [Geomicrobium sp. JCM 19039]|uniref:glutaredoxin family protein n=1 Tax=Geomicrobium sp. JCM 19039 TaxID=1460636 RepID=UPI00045F4481|nr:glutaredoxin family protein [Geomicrobium sp. JCM 19039]GAK13056.1 glutaredoxin family protein [Geomicrobium sp. JCM 19039]
MSQTIIVWSKAGCHYCEEVRGFLRGKNVAFSEIDITEKDDYRDILEVKYGIRHVPVVEIGNDHVYSAVTEVGIEHVEKALQQT